MPASLQLSIVHLRVSDLTRSIDFYARRLGFVVLTHADGRASLGPTPDLPALMLTGHPHMPPPPRDAAGLFHAAMLLPSRAALATWLQFTAARSVDFEGFSDHGVSDAIYLSDPDGNGLEFYADRPRATWPFSHSELAMITRPLDVRKLLAEATSATPTPLAGAHWGHLHLRVTDLARSEAFYRDALAVSVTQRSFPSARFLAADGYHHHLGLNTWGNPRIAQPPDALGLAEATFIRTGITNESVAVDPDGIHLRLQPALVPA